MVNKTSYFQLICLTSHGLSELYNKELNENLTTLEKTLNTSQKKVRWCLFFERFKEYSYQEGEESDEKGCKKLDSCWRKRTKTWKKKNLKKFSKFKSKKCVKRIYKKNRMITYLFIWWKIVQGKVKAIMILVKLCHSRSNLIQYFETNRFKRVFSQILFI